MRRVQKVFAVGASGLLLTMAVTPAALAVGTVSASSGKIAAAANYKGKTSQRKACVARNLSCGKIAFTKSSGQVSGTITWKAHCTPTAVLTSGTTFKANLTNGKFAVNGTYHASINNGKFEGRYTVSIAGTVGARKAHGTFSGRAAIFQGSTKVAVCKSGPVTWTASKQ